MIYVFKTSVKTKGQVRRLHADMNRIVPGGKWNFDLQDCDKILRIDCDQNIVLEVIDVLANQEIHCEELE